MKFYNVRILVAGPLLVLAVSAALVARAKVLDGSRTTVYEPAGSSIGLGIVDDDPCDPDFGAHVKGIGSGGDGTVSGEIQAELCPEYQVIIIPTGPRDPCPDPVPYRPPPAMAPPPDLPPNSAGAMGSPEGNALVPATYDAEPAPMFSADYGGEAFQRSRLLDSPFVDAATGELSLIESDLHLPGSGIDFAALRYYNSFLADYRGQYGAGWELSCHRRVAATYLAGSTPVDLQLVTGAGYPTGKFYPSGNDWFTNVNRLEQFHFSAPANANAQVKLYKPTGLVETYERLNAPEHWFYLTKIETPFGVSMTYSYTPDTDTIPFGLELSSVTDSVGRVIEFDFDDETNMLDEIEVYVGGQKIAQVSYEYLDPGVGQPRLLSKVTGLTVATESTATGQLQLQRRVHEYSYVQEAGSWYLKDSKNSLGELAHSWTYSPNSGGKILTQTDRPADPTNAGLHQYAYPTGKTTYTGPEGEQREWQISNGRVTLLRELVDASAGTWADTHYSYDPGCGCSRISEVIFPDQRRLQITRDVQGNPTGIWNYSAPGSNTTTRVERFLWTTFNPVNPNERIVRLLQHEQVRDAEAGEVPGNNCDKPDCGDTYGADGWIMHSYIWDQAAPWKLLEIDYGTIEVGNGQLSNTVNRKETFSYHPNGWLATRRQLEGSTEISRTEYGLDAAGHFLDSIKVVDVVNGGEWETSYLHDSFGRITQTEHEDGRLTRYDRDEAGRVWRRIEDYQPGSQSGSRTTELRYDREGRLVKETITSGSLTSKTEFVLDATGRPTQIVTTGPGGIPRVTQIEITKSGLLKSVTAWNGFQSGTDYQPGAWRLPTRTWEKRGADERTTWRAGDGGGDADGYDGMGRLTSFRNAADWVTVIRYDGHGRYKESFSQSDATHVAGRHVNYDARGFVSEVEVGMAEGQPSNPTAVSWNEHHVVNHNLAGHLLSWALYEGPATVPSRLERYRVDMRGRREVAWAYQGNRAAGVNAATKIVREYSWDALDRVLQERHLAPSGSTALETTDYWFDDISRTLEVIISGEGNAYRERAVAQRDALGRLTSITEWEWANGAWGQSRVFAREWDGLDRQTAAVDPLGKRWEWTYDDLHRTVTELVKPYGQGQILQTSWAYDAATGSLVSVTDAEGEITQYSVFTSGQAFLLPKKTTYPDGRWEEIFAYDAMRRPTSLGDSRGVTRSLTWDYGYLLADDSNAETLIANGDQHLAGADRMEWEYDRLTGYPLWSKLKTVGVETWRTEFTYNKIGELGSEKQGLPGAQHAFSWVYGFGGETRSVTYPIGLGLDAGVITRDTAGRVTGVQYTKASQTLANYALTFDGLRAKRRTENVSGVQLDYAFDTWNRLTGMIWSKGTTTFDGQSRTLDLGNRVIARQRAMDATGEVFSHDGHHRMTAWWQGVQNPLAWTGAADPTTWTAVERYTLDGVLARTQIERQTNGGSPVTTTYATNAAHFYNQAGGESRTTHHGFLNGDGTHFYRYDAWGRLTEVRAAASGAVIRTHVYDCEGRRVLETETNGGPSVTTRYVFWGAGLAASYNVAGGNTRTYGFVGGADGEAFVRVQQSGADNVFELARDFQGTILALIQRTNPASVSVVERYRYEPFGKVAIENASGQPLTQSGFGNDRFFLGRVWDAEVGLYDVRARWYEPDLGTFLAPDPLGAVDSWNFYQYGLAEPNAIMDPTGLQHNDETLGHMADARADGGGSAGSGGGDSATGDSPADDIVSAGVGLVPVVSTVHDGAAFFTGYDCITGERLSRGERMIAGLGMVIPWWSSAPARAAAKGVNAISDANKGAKGAEAAGDAARASDARFAVDEGGGTVDTHSTPKGSYQQPDGSRTDVLQDQDHGSGRTHTHEAVTNTNPKTGETFVNGVKQEGRPPTYQEMKNIENGVATRLPPRGRGQ